LFLDEAEEAGDVDGGWGGVGVVVGGGGEVGGGGWVGGCGDLVEEGVEGGHVDAAGGVGGWFGLYAVFDLKRREMLAVGLF